jgi:polyhydroxyalkanoate synthase
VPPLASLTLLAAQTDFSEPGELGLFIDESQVGYLDEITRGQGCLSGEQMAGSFQFLHSRDLVWTRRMREYLMGEREQRSDLMAWNADTTRLPARMHHEYLTALYLHNALATGQYRVHGQAVSLADIHLPVFAVGTERDHISPWRSVFKLHHLCDAEIDFVLCAGGHNAGIISEPGHPHRSYRIGHRPAHGAWVEPTHWLRQATSHDGSWWPAWQSWLARRSGPLHTAQPIPPGAALARPRASTCCNTERPCPTSEPPRQTTARGRWRSPSTWCRRCTPTPQPWPNASASGWPRCWLRRAIRRATGRCCTGSTCSACR